MNSLRSAFRRAIVPASSGAHEPAVADDVRGQNRRELAFDARGDRPASSRTADNWQTDVSSRSSRALSMGTRCAGHAAGQGTAQRLVQIVDQVGRVLEADREAQQVVGDAERARAPRR